MQDQIKSGLEFSNNIKNLTICNVVTRDQLTEPRSSKPDAE